MRRKVLSAVFVALFVAGAVTAAVLLIRTDADRDGQVAARAGGAPSPTTAPAPTTTLPPTTTTFPRRGSGQPVTFAFGGDVHFEGGLRDRLAADPATVLAPIAPVLAGADLTVVNLESAITERGEPALKEFTFRAPPSALTALAAGGVDVASMANNHGMDYGPTGLQDSLAARTTSPVAVVGIGADATEAYAPFRTTIKGQRIAVIGATQVLDDNLIGAWTATDAQGGLASAKDVGRLVVAVQEARGTSDTVVVFLHWGVEAQTCPSGDQQQLAQTLVDAGADIVVGGHAHRLQGAGRHGAAFVAYGLGNFAFSTRGGPGASTGVFLVTATGRDIDTYSFVPAVIEGGVPRPLEGEAAAAAIAAFDGLRGCTDLQP